MYHIRMADPRVAERRAELTNENAHGSLVDERPKKRPRLPDSSTFSEQHGRLGGFQIASWRQAVNPECSARLATEANALHQQQHAGGTTSWIGPDETPECCLEAFAQAVFQCHRQPYVEEAGAEFWVEVSSAAGKASVAATTNSGAVHFESDGDRHPDVVTHTWVSIDDPRQPVAPLVVFDSRRTDEGRPSPSYEYGMFGMQSNASGPGSSYLAFPASGTHVALQGELLHGCPRSMELLAECTGGDCVKVVVSIWNQGKPGRCTIDVAEERRGQGQPCVATVGGSL